MAASTTTGSTAELNWHFYDAYLLLDEPPLEGRSKRAGGLLAKALGDVPKDHVWRELRAQQISLRRRSWF